MGQAADGDRLDVVGRHVAPRRQDGVGLGGADQPDGGPRAGAEAHAGRRPAGPAELDGVRRHRLVRRAPTRSPSGRSAIPRACRPAQLGQRVLAAAVERQLHLLRRVGIADGRRDGETVELALHQREGAALRVRVLGGDHQVRAGQRPGLAVDADLLLLHRLEEGRLRARRGAVELVDQHHVGEDRARAGSPSSRCRA